MTTQLWVVGLAAMLAAGLYGLAVTWWASMFDRLQGDPFQQFDTRGVVLIGYAAFAFALGVALGAILRRTLPAMAATFAVFFSVHLAFSTWLRQHLLSPLHAVSPFSLSSSGVLFNGPPGAWVLSSELVTSNGRNLGPIGPGSPVGGGFRVHAGRLFFQGVGACRVKIPAASLRTGNVAQSVLQACVARFHLSEVVTYQPESRYWAFQWLELGLFLALALALAAAATWWVRRRLS